MNKQLATYQRAQVNGASQRDLIVMCYKGGIKYLVESRQKLEAGDINGFSELIEKAHRVIVYGSFAIRRHNLLKLYTFESIFNY